MAKATAKAAAEEITTMLESASEAAPKKAAPKADIMYVLDTTALVDPVNPVARVHQQLVDGTTQQFTFQPGKGLPLPRTIAVKFLQHAEFQLVDADGNPLAYKRPPKQPDQLQAGEQLKLADDETVARYDELSSDALAKRVLAMHGGEAFSKKASTRGEIIKFIIDHKKKKEAANKSKEPDVKADDFVPMTDFDEHEEEAA